MSQIYNLPILETMHPKTYCSMVRANNDYSLCNILKKEHNCNFISKLNILLAIIGATIVISWFTGLLYKCYQYNVFGIYIIFQFFRLSILGFIVNLIITIYQGGNLVSRYTGRFFSYNFSMKYSPIIPLIISILIFLLILISRIDLVSKRNILMFPPLVVLLVIFLISLITQLFIIIDYTFGEMTGRVYEMICSKKYLDTFTILVITLIVIIYSYKSDKLMNKFISAKNN